MEKVNRKVNVFDCSIIELPRYKFRAGNISIFENIEDLPFEANRIFYIYDIPGGEDRGAHAHRECHQFLIAVSGSFEVELDDGIYKKTVVLNRPFNGLHIPPGIWAAEKGFSAGAVCLVIASDIFKEEDYIRDYSSFIHFKHEL
jgi:hypothetical protein